MLFLISTVILAAALFYGVSRINVAKEREIKLSHFYFRALDDWSRLQVWFAKQYENKEFPAVTFMLDEGTFAAVEVSFWKGSDGSLMMTSGLSPSEFVLAVRRIKKFFDFK